MRMLSRALTAVAPSDSVPRYLQLAMPLQQPPIKQAHCSPAVTHASARRLAQAETGRRVLLSSQDPATAFAPRCKGYLMW